MSHVCPGCETKGGAYLAHYGVMRCSCGLFFWALQLRRDGPLVLFPHPGFYPAQREAHPAQFQAGARENTSPKVRVAGMAAGDRAPA